MPQNACPAMDTSSWSLARHLGKRKLCNEARLGEVGEENSQSRDHSLKRKSPSSCPKYPALLTYKWQNICASLLPALSQHTALASIQTLNFS